MKKVLSLVLMVLIVFSMLSIMQVVPVLATTDQYFIYSKFDPPGIGDVVGAGGYVEYYGVPEWGDEIQYVYFLSGNTGYKVKVWVTDGDGDGKIEPRQHPNHYLSEFQGPIEPRHFEIVSSKDLSGYTSGSRYHSEEFYVDSSGVYLGAYPNGIHKWDHDWNYIGKIANSPPTRTESMAYNPAENVWYAGGRYRTIYQLSDTDNDGSFLDESWVAIFTYPSYGGSHHDGMEYVGGYLWISDMTSDVIGKWQYDTTTSTWRELKRFTYSEPGYVEGMGFGPNDHFWVGSGWGSGSYIYELGNEITKGYPIANAGPDVDAHPPIIPVRFDASGSHHTDPAKQIVLYEWDFESDGTWDYSGTDLIVEHAYPAYYNPDGSIDWDKTAKDYTAALRVTDNSDPPFQDTDTRIVHITAPPWKPVADPDGPYEGYVKVPVQLDGSKSYDPESTMFPPDHPWYETIATYEWDLDGDGEFDDATGVKPTWTWDTEGNYRIGLKVTDSQPSGPGGTIGPLDYHIWYTTVVITKEWTFAIITDLHIGRRGYPDRYYPDWYDPSREPWDDAEAVGQRYYLTERLKNVVEWIKNNRGEHNIQFVMVLGDIANNGESSELRKAKAILDDLGEIPYLPVIGNHDVWSWTKDDEEKPLGDSYFNDIFSEAFFVAQFEKLRVTWNDFDEDPLLQNYAFNYRGVNFVSLDCVSRNQEQARSGEAFLHDETKRFLIEGLATGNPTILFSHHPMVEKEILGWDYAFDDEVIEVIGNIINDAENNYGTEVLANFAGHIHGFYGYEWPIIKPKEFMNANKNYTEDGFVTPAGISVVTTESMMVASNELTSKEIIRIVKMEANKIKQSYTKGVFPALNPHFKEIDIEWPPLGKITVEFEAYAFAKMFTEERSGIYIMDFGDGTMPESIESKRWDKEVEFKHSYTGGKTYYATLTVIGWTPEGEKINEKITQRIDVPRPLFGIGAHSPVDITVTDPDGLVINKQINEISRANYVEVDFNEDGDLDDIIVISDRKIGDYLVNVLPEADVAPTDTYTLWVWPETRDEPFVLADNVQICNIPTHPYIVRSTETEVIPIIPATVDFDPDTLNLNSTGLWVTVYIELPVGHGYDVSMINSTSIMLNGQVQAEIKPTAIGDYDSDGIPDLMVKFSRAAVQNIVSIGDQVKITISGKLIDGRLFEGTDTIKVILPP